MSDTPRTDDQFRDAAKMVPTDCCNSAPEKRLADGIRYWDCSTCGATIWVENPVKDHNEQHLEMVPTPRTDAFQKGDGLLESWEQEWEAAVSFARQLERALAETKDEYCKTAFELTKQIERAEKAEAEVERLQSQLKRAVEIAEMFSQVKGLHHQCNCAMCKKLAALKSQIK